MSGGSCQDCLIPTDKLLVAQALIMSPPGWNSHLRAGVPALGSNLIVRTEGVNPFTSGPSIPCGDSKHKALKELLAISLKEKKKKIFLFFFPVSPDSTVSGCQEWLHHPVHQVGTEAQGQLGHLPSVSKSVFSHYPLPLLHPVREALCNQRKETEVFSWYSSKSKYKRNLLYLNHQDIWKGNCFYVPWHWYRFYFFNPPIITVSGCAVFLLPVFNK